MTLTWLLKITQLRADFIIVRINLKVIVKNQDVSAVHCTAAALPVSVLELLPLVAPEHSRHRFGSPVLVLSHNKRNELVVRYHDLRHNIVTMICVTISLQYHDRYHDLRQFITEPH